MDWDDLFFVGISMWAVDWIVGFFVKSNEYAGCIFDNGCSECKL